MIEKIEYSDAQLLLISAYLSLDNFDHTYWSDEKIPAVFTHPIKTLKRYIKNHYRTTQGYTCAYCRCQNLINHGASWHIEHIIPKELNYQLMFEPENLCISCPDCNQFKGKKSVLIEGISDSKRSEDFIIVHPHYDNYDDHIERIGTFPIVFIPKENSSKGKYTIKICRLARFISLQFDGEIRDLDFYDIVESIDPLSDIEKLNSEIEKRWDSLKN